MVYVCYVLLKETSIHINFICFNRNFDHLHINVVTFVPRKLSNKPIFSTKNVVLVEKVFDMYLLLGLSSLFSQNSLAFLKKLLLLLYRFEKLTKGIVFDCFGVRFVSPFSKKSQTFKMTEKAGK